MTFIDNLKASGTLCEGVGPQRPVLADAGPAGLLTSV